MEQVEEFFNNDPDWIPIYAERYKDGWGNFTGEWHEQYYDSATHGTQVGEYKAVEFWKEALHDYRVAFDPEYPEYNAAAAATFEFKLSEEDWDWVDGYYGETDYVGRPHAKNTRYVEFTSWEGMVGEWSGAGAIDGGDAYGETGAGKRLRYSNQGENVGLATYTHEFAHIVGVSDNYGNPWTLDRSALTENWALMSRGSFSGPFGDLARWTVPGIESETTGCHFMQRNKTGSGFYDKGDLLDVGVRELAEGYPVVADIVARNIPIDNELYPNPAVSAFRDGGRFVKGIRLAFEAGATDPYRDLAVRQTTGYTWNANNGLTGNDNRSLAMGIEVVQRTGYDSYLHDNGVLISRIGGDNVPGGGSLIALVSSHLYDLDMVDYYLNGNPVYYPIGHATQQAAATFKVGKSFTDTGYYASLKDQNGDILIPGSEWGGEAGNGREVVAGDTVNEWVDPYNKLHFYILQKHMNNAKYGEFMSYEVAVRHLDGKPVGGELQLEAKGSPTPATIGNYAKQTYSLKNTGDATDIVRIGLGGTLAEGRTREIIVDTAIRRPGRNDPFQPVTRTVPTPFSEQSAAILNDLYAIGPGETIEFDVFIKKTVADDEAFDTSEALRITASSETNASKEASVKGPTLPEFTGFHKDTPARSIEKTEALGGKYAGFTGEDGKQTQPTFQFSNTANPSTNLDTIFEEVWIEVPCDTDENGARDLVRIQIIRPAETGVIIDDFTGETEVSVPVLMEHSPYRVGATTRPIPLWNVWRDQSANPPTAGYTYSADIQTKKPRANNWSWKQGASYWDKDAMAWMDDTIGGDPSWFVSPRAGMAAGAWFIPESQGDREIVFQGNWPATRTSLSALGQYYYTRGYAYVHSASLGNDFNEAGWEGYNNCGNVEETLPVMAIIKWLNGDPAVKGYTDRNATKEVVATWCNGSVAMTGASYDGTLPIAAAMSGVEGLKAILPVAAISSWYDYYRGNGAVVAPGGWQGEDADYLAARCFALGATKEDIPAGFWAYLDQMGADKSRETGDYNSFWDDRNYLTMIDSVRDDCGIMIMHGTNDWNVKTGHADRLYRALKDAKKNVKALWHLDAHTTVWDKSESHYIEYFHLWMDSFLYGLDNDAVERIPEVNIPNNNGLNWQSFDSWPIAGSTYEKFYLNAPTANKAGAMTAEAPIAGTAGKIQDDREANSFVTAENPATPTSIDYNRSGIVSAELNRWENNLFSLADIDVLSDERLAFAIDLTEPLRINGTVKVGLELSSNMGWGTISVALVEMGPNYRDRTNAEAGVINSGNGTSSFALNNYTSAATRSQFKVVTRGHVDLQNPNPGQTETYLNAPKANGFVPAYYYQTRTISPGTDYKYYFTLEPMDYTFKAGTRLAIYVYTSDYRHTQVAKTTPPEFTIKTGEGTFVELPIVPTYSVFYNANGGTSEYFGLGGYSDAYPIAGQSAKTWEGNKGYLVATSIGNTSVVKLSLRPGYEFRGWNTKADGSGTAYAVGDRIPDDQMSDLTLYAQWYRPPTGTDPGGLSPVPIPPVSKEPGLATAEVTPTSPGPDTQSKAVNAVELLDSGWAGDVRQAGQAVFVDLPEDVPTIVTLADEQGWITMASVTTMAILNDDGTLTPVPTRVIGGKIVVILRKDAVLVPLSVSASFGDLQHVTTSVQSEINKAAAYMIVEGFPGGEFRPSADVTVQQAVTMFLRASGIPVDYATAMATGAEFRFVGAGMSPRAPMSRIQTAQLIANALAYFGLKYALSDSDIADILDAFPDVDGLGGAELEALAICVKLKIFQGHDGGTMDPNGILKRSQLASLAIRMQDVLFGLS